MNIFKYAQGKVELVELNNGNVCMKVGEQVYAPENKMGIPYEMTAELFVKKFLAGETPPLSGRWVNTMVAKSKARKFLNIKSKRTGRPLFGDAHRVRFGTTVAPETLKKIQKDKKSSESIGQVIDRWAKIIK